MSSSAPVRRARSMRLVLACAGILLIAGCGGGLSDAEDDWCSEHLPEVRAEIPRDQLDEYEYRDDTWKDACRRAFAER